MTSPFKGAIQQALVGRSGPKGPIGRAVQGALARVPRPAPPPKGPPPSNAKGQAFRGRNAGPIKPNPVTEADQTLGQTGEGLRRTIGRIATGRMVTAAKGGKIDSVETLVKKFNQAQKDFREGKEQSPRKQQRLRNRLRAMGYDFTGKPEGSEDEIQPITPPSKPPKKFKEGGKVGGAMSALQKLAQQYKAALDMDDTEKAARVKRQMERLKRGSTKEADDEAEAVGKEKAATFAKGGKVSRVKRMQEILARDFRKAKKMKDSDSVKVRFGSKEDTHIRAGGKKYSFQAGSDDDRFNFRSNDGEEIPVEFSPEWLKENE